MASGSLYSLQCKGLIPISMVSELAASLHSNLISCISEINTMWHCINVIIIV